MMESMASLLLRNCLFLKSRFQPRYLSILLIAAIPSSILGDSVSRADLISGDSSAIFVNPVPPGSFVTGEGTNDFTYGDPTGFSTGPSRLIFTGATFNTVTEQDFLIGTLSYFNGTVNPPAVDGVDLRTRLVFTTPAVGLQTTDFHLQFINTPNTGTPVENADAVIFPSFVSSTAFILDGVQYTLQLRGFRNVVGDGFISSDSQRLNALEGGTASAQLFARVTSAAVPEPSSVVLLATGAFVLAGLALTHTCRGQARESVPR